MKRIIFTLAGIFILNCSIAQFAPAEITLKKGIYYTHASESKNESIITHHGDIMFVKTGFELKHDKVFIYSINNENSMFSVEFLTEKFNSENDHFVLIAGDMKFIRYSSGSWTEGEKTYYDLTFQVNEEEAQKLSRAFNTTVKYRTNPGHQISCEFIPHKKTYYVGDTVNLTLRLKNTGKITYYYEKGGMYRNKTGRCDNFKFDVFYSGEKLKDPNQSFNFGGMFTMYEMKPGDTDSLKTCLTHWCNFDKPGIYTIECSYVMNLQFNPMGSGHLDYLANTGKYWNDKIKQTITIEVLP